MLETPVSGVERQQAPSTVAATGLDLGLLADLALKALYFGGNIEQIEISHRLALSPNVTADVMEFLRRERLSEVTGGNGRSEGRLRYSLTSAGIERAVAALAISGYVGPAPVPLRDYIAQVRKQSIFHVDLARDDLEAGLEHLVLPRKTIDLIGQAMSSRRATLLYGASGNGKTSAAIGLGTTLPGHILIPQAVEVMREIIQLYDPSSHEIVEDDEPSEFASRAIYDRRWVVIKRPVVFAAGELAANHLELMLDKVHKTYEAPIQMKANGGMMIIDDFGRQRLDASYLLNRWVIPLERQIDYLSLHSGARFEVPFDAIPMFVSNLDPSTLADEAFLRRIRYKIEIPSPDRKLFLEILRRECEQQEVAYEEAAANYFIDNYFVGGKHEMRGCHPRDIVQAIADAARYRGADRALTSDTIDDAYEHYFV